MADVEMKYNLQLNDDPILKARQLYPIENVVVVTLCAVPISDMYSEYIETNIGEICNHFRKDLILRATVPSVMANNPGIDVDFTIKNMNEDGDEYCTFKDEDEDIDDIYDDDEDGYNPYMDEDEDDIDDCEEEMYGSNMFPGNCENETFDEFGLFYNFSSVFPRTKSDNTVRYFFEDSLLKYDQPALFTKEESDMLNTFIDSENGKDWMFLFQFRHPISYYNDIQKQHLLSEETITLSDRVIYSLIDSVSNGIVNVTSSETMRLILKAMIGSAASHGRIPFVGNVRFQVVPERFPQQVQYNYSIWLTELYNKILEDIVNFESKNDPPVIIKDGEVYFKPTDFLGQYYFPKGIKRRKEEGQNAGEEENNLKNNEDYKDTKKDNKKKDSGQSKSSGGKRKSSASSRGSKRSNRKRAADDAGSGSA